MHRAFMMIRCTINFRIYAEKRKYKPNFRNTII